MKEENKKLEDLFKLQIYDIHILHNVNKQNEQKKRKRRYEMSITFRRGRSFLPLLFLFISFAFFMRFVLSFKMTLEFWVESKCLRGLRLCTFSRNFPLHFFLSFFERNEEFTYIYSILVFLIPIPYVSMMMSLVCSLTELTFRFLFFFSSRFKSLIINIIYHNSIFFLLFFGFINDDLRFSIAKHTNPC